MLWHGCCMGWVGVAPSPGFTNRVPSCASSTAKRDKGRATDLFTKACCCRNKQLLRMKTRMHLASMSPHDCLRMCDAWKVA